MENQRKTNKPTIFNATLNLVTQYHQMFRISIKKICLKKTAAGTELLCFELAFSWVTAEKPIRELLLGLPLRLIKHAKWPNSSGTRLNSAGCTGKIYDRCLAKFAQQWSDNCRSGLSQSE